MTTTSSRSNRANRANNQYATVEAAKVATVETVEAVDVETQTETVTALPVAVESAKVGKVDAKEALKSANVLKSRVKAERRGANVTIRLIAEAAASGDKAAVNVLCALCDVPREALFGITVDNVREAVKAYYPYYVETDARRINVKPCGVWYSTRRQYDTMEDAAKRVQRGYVSAPVADYLEQLIRAAKSRAKGVQPRRVDAEAIYNKKNFSHAEVGISAAEIEDAKKRKYYLANAVNVWKKDRTGFYI